MGAVADSPAEPKQGAKRYAGYSDQGQEQWQQEALYAQGTYVAIGEQVLRRLSKLGRKAEI